MPGPAGQGDKPAPKPWRGDSDTDRTHAECHEAGCRAEVMPIRAFGPRARGRTKACVAGHERSGVVDTKPEDQRGKQDTQHHAPLIARRTMSRPRCHRRMPATATHATARMARRRATY